MIRVAINGYGNLGRGVEQAITKNADMEVAVVFTRRDPASVNGAGPVAAGSQADLVLLAEDPLRLGAEELEGVRPVVTVVAGAVAHLRG